MSKIQTEILIQARSYALTTTRHSHTVGKSVLRMNLELTQPMSSSPTAHSSHTSTNRSWSPSTTEESSGFAAQPNSWGAKPSATTHSLFSSRTQLRSLATRTRITKTTTPVSTKSALLIGSANNPTSWAKRMSFRCNHSIETAVPSKTTTSLTLASSQICSLFQSHSAPGPITFRPILSSRIRTRLTWSIWTMSA